MSAPDVRLIDNKPVGRWDIYAYPVLPRDHRSRTRIPVTRVRGLPTVINSLTFTEPFGPAEASLTFPAVSALEPLGFGSQDLWWLQPDIDIDIVWTATDPQFLEYIDWVNTDMAPGWTPMRPYLRWEGFISGFDVRVGQGEGVTVNCTGAMRMLDYRVAQRVVSSRPVPFEYAIANAFREANARHTTRLQELAIELYPWSPYYRKTQRYINGKWYDSKPWYMQPKGVQENQQWSGLLTRELGTWGKVLSDYVMMLLKVMYTESGQYTLQLDPGRQPVLRHRTNTVQSIQTAPSLLSEELNDPAAVDYVRKHLTASKEPAYVDPRRMLVVDLTHPGVNLNVANDFSQSVTTIYGNVATTYTGTSYNGMQFEANGTDYWYEPFAKTPWVDSDQGAKVRPWAIRREVHDDFPEGLTPAEAKMQARRFLSLNSSPGLVGSLSMESVDPMVRHKDGELITFPRQLVGANMIVRLDGLQGQRPGPLVYVNEANYNAESDALNLQIDSKFRDFMTTADVRLRGRDALLPNHTINVRGGYEMNISDPILPWSYAKGCGFFPYESRKMWERFTTDGNDPEFYEGWQQMTRTFPPKDHPEWYSTVVASPFGRGTKNKPMDPIWFWNIWPGNAKHSNAKVLLSQAGTIMNTQFIAVDKDGNIVPVSYHVSVWALASANGNNTPEIPSNEKKFPGNVVLTEVTKKNGTKEWMYAPDGRRWYKKNGHYPFFPHAWFDYDDTTGKRIDEAKTINPADADAIVYGVGNHYDRAGFWPSTFREAAASGGSPTGMFVDSSEWTYTMERFREWTDNYSEEMSYKTAMKFNVLIFCDDRPKENIYFLGRFYKKPEEGGYL